MPDTWSHDNRAGYAYRASMNAGLNARSPTVSLIARNATDEFRLGLPAPSSLLAARSGLLVIGNEMLVGPRKQKAAVTAFHSAQNAPDPTASSGNGDLPVSRSADGRG